MASDKTPAWVWISCGCLLALLGLVAVVGGVGFAGFSFFKGMVDDMADPARRMEAGLDQLGAETLPDDWRVQAVFRVPWMLSLVVLSDGETPPAVDGGLEEKLESLESLALDVESIGRDLFVYLQLRGRKDSIDDVSIEQVLAGDRTRSGAQVDLGVEFKNVEELDQGELSLSGRTVTWSTRRGTLVVRGGEVEGTWAALGIRCADGKVHDAVWFRRSGDTATSLDVTPDRELASGPSDPADLERALSYFDACG